MSGFVVNLRFLTNFFKVWDVAAVVFALVLAANLLLPDFQVVGIQEFLTIELQLRQDLMLALLLLAWSVLLHAFRVYSRATIVSPRASISSLVIVNAIGAFLLVSFAALSSLKGINLFFAAIVWGGATTFEILPRLVIAFLLRRRARNPKNYSNFLIVGTNLRSEKLAKSLSSDVIQPRRFVGFVDFQCRAIDADEQDSAQGLLLDPKELRNYLRHSHIDEVMVCLPLKSYYDETMDIIACCEEQGVTVHVLADLFEARMTHSRIRYFANQPLITVASHEMHGLPALTKRVMDVIFASALLVLLSPIILLASIAVLLTSHGPIIFSQERVGLNKKRFLVHKFRTMVTDAESRQAALQAHNEANGPVFKIQDDPRITAVGKFLRKFSIDELPQLVNVIQGEMSLVGPRPLAIRDYEGFDEDWHRRRLSVRPGVTGLWQVNDRRHGSFEQWMQLDMQYIDQWSIWLDLKILASTIPAVLRGSGQ